MMPPPGACSLYITLELGCCCQQSQDYRVCPSRCGGLPDDAAPRVGAQPVHHHDGQLHMGRNWSSCCPEGKVQVGHFFRL